MTTSAHAQFRRIPGSVTDSFKLRYPSAHDVTWEDKITAFQASFKLDTAKMTARYGNQGEWQGSEKKVGLEQLPAAVKDGFSKSKYADWSTSTVTIRYLPGDQTQYSVVIYKGNFQRKTLIFSSVGQLLKD